MKKELRLNKEYRKAAALSSFCNWNEEARKAMIENRMVAALGKEGISGEEISKYIGLQLIANGARRIGPFPGSRLN